MQLRVFRASNQQLGTDIIISISGIPILPGPLKMKHKSFNVFRSSVSAALRNVKGKGTADAPLKNCVFRCMCVNKQKTLKLRLGWRNKSLWRAAGREAAAGRPAASKDEGPGEYEYSFDRWCETLHYAQTAIHWNTVFLPS